MPFIDNSSLPITNEFVMETLGLSTLPQLSILALDSLEKSLGSGKLQPALYLDELELEQYGRYRYRKRRLEWLGGRMAAKMAVLNMLGRQPSRRNLRQWPVAADQHGRPYFRSESDNPPRLSISHSGELAGALVVSNRECGLDLQKISAATARVREKFCSTAENVIISSLRPITTPEAGLTLLWSAKESLRKARGGHPLTGFLEMDLVLAEKFPGAVWVFTMLAADSQHRVIAYFYNDFAIAITSTLE